MAKLTNIIAVVLLCIVRCHLTVSIPCNVTPSIETRTENANVIVKGRVLRLLLDLRTPDNYFPADVVVTEFYKGNTLLHNLTTTTLPAPYAGVTNVYRIGNFKKDPCIREIQAHEEYLIFLTTGMSRPVGDGRRLTSKGNVGTEYLADEHGEGRLQLQAKYDETIVDPLEVYSRKKENRVLDALGWTTWSVWTHCSEECGEGNTQTRKRTCEKDLPDACQGTAKEERECNKFDCTEMKDMLIVMNLQDALHVKLPRHRDKAYEISTEASISIRTSLIHTQSFPEEFSILLVLKPKPVGSSLDNSNLYPLVIVDSQNRLQLAIHIGRYPAILYGTPDGVRTVTFRDYSLNRQWQYLAFGIERDTVTLIADCSQKSVHSLPVGDTISIGIDGYSSIGRPEYGVVDLEDVTFSGDIEQFVFLEDPDSAQLQCSSHTRMLPIPPASLFDHYPVPDSSNVDVPFNFDPDLVNPAFNPTTGSPIFSVPTFHPMTDGMFESSLYPRHLPVDTDAPETQAPEVPIDNKNVIPPVNIIPGGEKEGENVYPSRGDNPDIRPSEIKRPPATKEPEVQSSEIKSTTEPKIIAPHAITIGDTEDSTIRGQPAEVPDNTDGEVSPPGDEPPEGNGGLFEEEEYSGDMIYDDVGVEWSTWSTCTTTCGLGTRYRFGFCKKDSTYLDCQRGHTITAQRKNCQLNDCPGDLQWSDWSSCSRTCGGNSVKTRLAFCPDARAHAECMHPGQTIVEREICDVPACYDICQEACQNGGACHGGFCICPPGYAGEYCQHQTCNPQCRNEGICLGNNICRCPEGTYQPYCSRRCTPECQNGAECTSGNRCQCKAGFHGFRCELATCTLPCQNGGRCIGPDKCQCPAGYEGIDCSTPQCLLGCENGGQCIRPDYCRCPPAYRGPRCEIGYCRARCRNGGTCVGADRCKCPKAYTGAFCQKSKCPRGCSPSMTCVGHNRCVPKSFAVNTKARGSSGGKAWCPLELHNQRIQTSYVKPVIRSIQIPCGPFGYQRCNSQRLEYTIAYRATYKASYRCANRG